MRKGSPHSRLYSHETALLGTEFIPAARLESEVGTE